MMMNTTPFRKQNQENQYVEKFLVAENKYTPQTYTEAINFVFFFPNPTFSFSLSFFHA